MRRLRVAIDVKIIEAVAEWLLGIMAAHADGAPMLMAGKEKEKEKDRFTGRRPFLEDKEDE